MDPALIGLITITITTLITNIYQISSQKRFHSECSSCTVDYESDTEPIDKGTDDKK